MSPKIYPLGDQALTIDFGNRVDENINRIVLTRFQQIRSHALKGVIELIPAYSSLTVVYDPLELKTVPGSAYDHLEHLIEELLNTPVDLSKQEGRQLDIPVLYEGMDLETVSKECGLTREEVIAMHTATPYRVYMLGFLPGFAYMGELNERLFTRRKSQPVMVEKGSVAIAGKQTGIYPLNSPGGWSVIGKTPISLLPLNSTVPALFEPGDTVKFFSITKDEFNTIAANENYHP